MFFIVRDFLVRELCRNQWKWQHAVTLGLTIVCLLCWMLCRGLHYAMVQTMCTLHERYTFSIYTWSKATLSVPDNFKYLWNSSLRNLNASLESFLDLHINPCSSWGVVEDKFVTLSFYEFTSSLRDSGEVSTNKPLFKSFSELQWQLGKLITTDMYLYIYSNQQYIIFILTMNNIIE